MSADSTGSSRFPVTGSIPFVRLMEVLSKYVSVRTSLTLLNKSLVELGHSPESMVMGDLPEVIETMMPGLRAFCADAQLNDLVLDLSALSSFSSAAHGRSSSGVTRRPLSSPPPAFAPAFSGSGHSGVSATQFPPAPSGPTPTPTPTPARTTTTPPPPLGSSTEAHRPGTPARAAHPGAHSPSAAQPISGHTPLGSGIARSPGASGGVADAGRRPDSAGEAGERPDAISSPRRR